MSALANVRNFVLTQLNDPGSQWSLGTFGALAEFMRDDDEPAIILQEDRALGATTGRGAIRFDDLDAVRLIAFETTSRHSWNHSVALCLPRGECAMGQRGVLTELGPDETSIRAADRDAILFDLGLRALQVDVCVRTRDPELLRALRAEAGASLFAPGGRAFAQILRCSPHRVFAARFGRIEVFTPIPAPDGRSPEGPHTHVLPKLLFKGLVCAATEPIPEDLVPCAHVYPTHPLKDALGRTRPFDATRHAAFQEILDALGRPELVDVKRRVFDALRAGKDPFAIALPDSRFARNSVRVALTQWNAAQGAAFPRRRYEPPVTAAVRR